MSWAALALAAAFTAPAVELEAGYGQDFLTRGHSDWRVMSLEAAWASSDRSRAGLGVRGLERFGLQDLDLGVTAGAPLGGAWDLGGEVSASPTHRVVPAWSAAAELHCAVGAGFGISLGVKQSRYQNQAGAASPTLGTLGVEYYWGSQRLGWTGYLAALASEWSASQRLAWDVYYGERSRIGVGVAAGRQLESTGGPRLLSSDVLAAAVGGRHEIGRDWAVTWEAGIQRQGDLYTRTGARIGLRRRL